MHTSVVFLCISVALLAIYFQQNIPEIVYLLTCLLADNFLKNLAWQFKIVGFSFGLDNDLVSCDKKMQKKNIFR